MDNPNSNVGKEESPSAAKASSAHEPNSSNVEQSAFQSHHLLDSPPRDRPRYDSQPIYPTNPNANSLSFNPSNIEHSPARSARLRTESVPESNKSNNSSRSILPQRGNDSDAESAIIKLEKMAKAHQHRRKWRTRTGVAGLVGDGRERERRKRERKEEEASSSDESVDLSRAFEEVRLKISSLPDHPVLGRVKGAVSNARDLLARNDTLKESSPRGSQERSSQRRGLAADEEDAGEALSGGASRTASFRRWGRNVSNSKHPSSRNSPAPVPDSALGEGLLSPQNHASESNGILRRDSNSSSPVGGAGARPSTSEEKLDQQRPSVEIQEPIQRPRTAGVAQTTDLGAVNEETFDTEEEAAKGDYHQGVPRPPSQASSLAGPAHAKGGPPALVNPKPSRAPFLSIDSPSDSDLMAESSPINPGQVDPALQNPSTSSSLLLSRKPFAMGMTKGDSSSSALSFLSEDEGHQVHDEPQSVMNHLVHQQPPPLPRETTRSPLSRKSSSDDEEVFEDSSDTSDDEEADTDDANAALASIVLNHGDSSLTKKERKRALRAEKQAGRAVSRASKKKGKGREGTAASTAVGSLERSGIFIEPFNWTGTGSGSDLNNGISSATPHDSQGHKRTQSIGHHVSKGLNYASSQSRNRRAMEKYSPNPNKALNGTKTPQISRPSSPSATGLQPSLSITGQLASRPSSAQGASNLRESLNSSRRNSINELEAPQYAFGPVDSPGSPLSELDSNRFQADDSPLSLTDLGSNFLQRWNTNQSMASSVGGGTITSTRRRFGLNAPKFLSRRRANTMGMEATDEAEDRTPKTEDVEKELDAILGKLTAAESPEDAKEKFEYDVMYENQRGLLVFGIPKFSSRTLFQWDPAPWTNSANENLAYNVVSAQLPDPSWEWVHPEWLIDMSGDTDESGWQYSTNFGHGPFRTASTLALKGISKPLPRAGKAGHEKMNQRLEEKMEKRENQEQTKDDDGLEALKRSAVYRQPKWRGAGDPWTFVRRRRWIRMRRRKALAPATKQTSGTSTPVHAGQQGLGQKQSSSHHLANGGRAGSGSDSMHESDDDSSASSTLSLSDDDSIDWATADANPSSFLPRRLPGDLTDGKPGDPSGALHPKQSSELERRKKHAKEFTGTVRELKSLLPAIVDKKHHKFQGSLKDEDYRLGVTEWWRAEVDARNPFISWKFVSRRLEDPDLSLASSSLKVREQRFSKMQNRRHQIPSSFGQEQAAATSSTPDANRFSTTSRPGSNSSAAPHPSGEYSLTRDALIELNFRRVLRVMKACKVDRQKLELWRLWLGAQTVESVTKEEPWGGRGSWADDLSTNDKPSLKAVNAARSKWKSTFIQPDATDVWDVLERRLDQVLLLFEFQASRVSLIRLLLTVHATSHPHHHFRPPSRQSRVSPRLDKDCNPESLDFGSNPSELSPTHRHGEDEEMGGSGRNTIKSQEWKRSGLPRLEFWSDLEACARSLVGAPSTPISDLNEEKATAASHFKSAALESPSSPSSHRTQQAIDEDQAFLQGLLAIPNLNRRRDWVRETSASDASSSKIREGGIRHDELR